MPIKIVRKTMKPASTPAVSTTSDTPAACDPDDVGTSEPLSQPSPDPFTLADDDELLTVGQAAELTGYAKVTVRRWIESGILAHRRAGRKKADCKKDHRPIRIRKSDLFKVFDQG